MATFTFIGDPNHPSVSWENAAVWSGDAFPNDPADDVVIPTIFFVSQPTQVYASTITVNASTNIASLSLANNTVSASALLTVGGDTDVQAGGSLGGNLVVGDTLTIATGGTLGAGAVVAGALDNSGVISGGPEGGSVQTGAFTNEAGGVVKIFSDFKTLTVNATSLNNQGELFALDSTLTVTVNPGGFANLANDTLFSGAYEAGTAAGVGTLQLNVGSDVDNVGAFVTLGAGSSDIEFFNTPTSHYLPIEQTVQAITPGGELLLENRSTTWGGPLAIEGALVLVTGSLTTELLSISPGGRVEAQGTINGPVSDSGTIEGLSSGQQSQFAFWVKNSPAGIDFTGAVSSSGTVIGSNLTFAAAASVNVILSGALTLDDAKDFTGSIAPQLGSTVLLPAVQLGSVTSFSYAPTDGDHGVLTLHMGAGAAIALDFTGHFDTGSFTLSNGQKITSSPPDVLITVVHAAPPPHDDFLGAGVSDVLLQNAAGQIDAGQLSGGSMALTEIFSSLGPQWKFEGNGDFLGTGVDQFLIENGSGSVGLGSVIGGALHLSTIASLDPTLKFIATGDFLNNGQAQFLTESSAGQIDLGQVAGGKATQTQIGTLGSQWKFVGTGDYLGKGHDQAAIENGFGSVGVGTVTANSLGFKTVGSLTSAQHIVETGDFLGDGKSDFLIDNTSTGQVQVAEVINGALTFTTVDTLGSQWKFVGAGDYLGDGHDQILIENGAGSLGVGAVADWSVHFMTVGTGFNEWVFH